MVQVFAVCGNWVIHKDSWNFVIDHKKGGKLFNIRNGMNFDELVQSVVEDYGIDGLVELSYKLPKAMLINMPKDTPPVIINNDRQLQSYLDVCGSTFTRLCVSMKRRSPESHREHDSILVFAEDGDVHGEEDDDVHGEEEDETDVEFGSDEDFHIHDGSVIRVGDFFKNKEALSWRMRMLSIQQKFRYFVATSTPTAVVVKCVDKSCKWKVRAATMNPLSGNFWVRKYVEEHTCSPNQRFSKSPRASTNDLSKLILEKFGNICLSMKPKLLSISLKKDYGLDISYWNIWKAREVAREVVRGSPEQSYAQLPMYLQKIKKANPGTVACLEVDAENRFKFLFLSFGASIKGFDFLRKVIVVDGTFLKGKYKGTLLVATTQDGNSKIYPIAFGVVDSENDASWEWFFTNLKSVIPDDPRLVVVSDRHASIAKAVEKVYPSVQRGICLYHLQKNIITKFKGRYMVRLVKKAAKAYTVTEFNDLFQEIRNQNLNLSTYLEEAGLQLWSRAYFRGDRYNITTSNIAESINAMFKEARELPIVPMLEMIRERLTQWYFERREKAAKHISLITPVVEKTLNKRCAVSSTFNVQGINHHEFQVSGGSRNFVVNCQHMTCTCRVFDVDKIPCEHVAAAAKSCQVDPQLLVHPYYTKSYWFAAYSESIKPPEEISELSPDLIGQICLPPNVRRSSGRPKKRRYQGIEETIMKRPRKQHVCSSCHRSGHYRTTCDFGV